MEDRMDRNEVEAGAAQAGPEAVEQASAADVTAAEAAADEEEWGDVDDFIGANTDFALPDPATVVTIRTTTGGDKYVPVSEPTPLATVIAQSGLFIGGAVQYYLNGSEIKTTDLVPGGATVSVIGSVKGGRG